MTNLIDWTPLARMLLLGVALALGPLAWLWLRSSGEPPTRRLHALTLLTLFLTFDLVLFGGRARLLAQTVCATHRASRCRRTDGSCTSQKISPTRSQSWTSRRGM